MPYNPNSQNLKALYRQIGTGNATGFKTRFFLGFMEELKFGDTLPSPEPNSFNIAVPIEFRAAVAANASTNTPAIPKGGVVPIDISDKKSSYDAGAKTEHGYTNYTPKFTCFIAKTNPTADFILHSCNGALLFVVFTDNNGFQRVMVNAEIDVKPQVQENENGYTLTFTCGTLPKPLYYITSP